MAKAQEEQSRFVYHIQTDLEAYFQRKQDPIYRNVLEQMKDQSVVPGLRAISAEALGNLNGRSVAAAEFWADTLDRWPRNSSPPPRPRKARVSRATPRACLRKSSFAS